MLCFLKYGCVSCRSDMLATHPMACRMQRGSGWFNRAMRFSIIWSFMAMSILLSSLMVNAHMILAASTRISAG